MVTGTRGLKFRNGGGKRGKESRKDQLAFGRVPESDGWSAEREPNNEERIGRKSTEKRALDCWYGIGKRAWDRRMFTGKQGLECWNGAGKRGLEYRKGE